MSGPEARTDPCWDVYVTLAPDMEESRVPSPCIANLVTRENKTEADERVIVVKVKAQTAE